MKTGGSPKEQARRRTEVLYKELKSAIEDICQLPEPHLRLKAHTLLAVHCIVVSSHKSRHKHFAADDIAQIYHNKK